MLNIHIQMTDPMLITKPGLFFNRNKKEEWFYNENVKRIIKNIDLTDVIEGEVLRSPVFGVMSPDRLSQGCKAVILLECYDGVDIYATRCGDNCVPDILEIGKRKDITITLNHCMRFPTSGFEAKIIETGKIIHSHDEFVQQYYHGLE